MRKLKSLQCSLLTFLVLIFIASCSKESTEIEDRIRVQAEKNNAELSYAEIKKTAAYLIEWGRPDFYEEQINVFLEADKSIEYSKDLILFTGSSSIRFWETLTQDMQSLPVLNRGFGGAHLAHVNHHFDQIVYPYNPKGIVIFCGTNDITALKTPEEVFEDFLIFFKKVQQQLPQTKIFFIGIKPTVARAYLKEEEQAFNQKIAQLSKENKNLIFIDVWDSMLIDDKPVAALFVEDGLHMNAEGYKIWTALVKPILDNTFSDDS
tara:strand:- start:6 stop:797 length:792 start_codon:yes stop_codon:yes gene_type:complete